MTDREVMQMALEALAYTLDTKHEHFDVDKAQLLSHRAVEHLQQALAQPEQYQSSGSDFEGMLAGSKEIQQAQPEQEPVAWVKDGVLDRCDLPKGFSGCLYVAPISEPVNERISEPDRNLEPVCDKDPQGCWSIRCQLGKVCKNTAPPKREWVGLTNEERVQAFVDAGLELAYMDYDADKRISEVIEAKLREKNT